MKKILLFIIAITAFTSCRTALLTTSASYNSISVQPVAALIADLEVSPAKISYVMVPSKSVKNGGMQNVLNTAVREALRNNGDYDVLVALETLVRYSDSGELESIVVSGYPAKYTNFRNPDASYWTEGGLLNMTKSGNETVTPVVRGWF